MSAIETFSPQGSTLRLTADTTASAATQVSTGNVSGLRINTVGSVVTWIAIGSSSVAAAIPSSAAKANGFAMQPNTSESFGCRPGCYVSAMTSAGSVDVTFTPGEGI